MFEDRRDDYPYIKDDKAQKSNGDSDCVSVEWDREGSHLGHTGGEEENITTTVSPKEHANKSSSSGCICRWKRKLLKDKVYYVL